MWHLLHVLQRNLKFASANYLGVEGMRDMDYVITTRELAKWAKEEGIDFASLEDGEYDNFMGDASGAGIIFGNTGGVMEAALRTAYEFITKEKSPEQLFNLTWRKTVSFCGSYDLPGRMFRWRRPTKGYHEG